MEYDLIEGDEERERFWNDLDRVMDRVDNGFRLCALGDLNGWVGDKVRVGITAAFRVPGENDNERRVIDFCDKRELCMSNTNFETT